MKERLTDILAGLLDDNNVALYLAFALAVLSPELRELVAGGILGWITKSAKDG